MLAAPSTDASPNNYQQCANGALGSAGATTDCVPQGWINGILNANNSQYHEDQVTAQRLGLDLPNGGPLTGRTITLKYLARKGQGGVGNHAYDSLATWNVTQTNADRCQGLTAANCPGGLPSTYLIPSDTTVVADSNGAGSSTAGHELPDAQRQMTMFGGTITNVSAPVHDNAAGSGDDYAQVTVTYRVSSTPTKVQLVFGGHLAASAGPRSWGANVGSSFINGGPYHIKLVQVDSSSIGNRDNQITSGAILPLATGITTTLSDADGSIEVNDSIHDSATLTGATSDAGGTVTYTVYTDNLCTTAAVAGTDIDAQPGSVTVTNGIVPDSSAVKFLKVGTYYWQASYSGQGINQPSKSACTSETLVVNKKSPGISTTLSDADGSVTIGSTVHDSATLSGATSDAGGSVTYTVYDNSSCTSNANDRSAGTVTVTNGVVPDSDALVFNDVGTFYWRAHYSGDAKNNAADSVCTSETLVVGKSTPTVPTSQSAFLNDSVTFTDLVTGGTGGSLTFTLFYDANDDGVCTDGSNSTPDERKFTQTVNNVTANSTEYKTANGNPSDAIVDYAVTAATDDHLYRWTVDYSGDSKNNAASSTCSENTDITITN